MSNWLIRFSRALAENLAGLALAWAILVIMFLVYGLAGFISDGGEHYYGNSLFIVWTAIAVGFGIICLSLVMLAVSKLLLRSNLQITPLHITRNSVAIGILILFAVSVVCAYAPIYWDLNYDGYVMLEKIVFLTATPIFLGATTCRAHLFPRD
ncbi:MAG: hypothetical protein K1X53_06580 [Candidatus Sumerlaeaceae bacterium]|nr:hypothetical protein [Candidatus Sumerlaeaceae bacterium]